MFKRKMCALGLLGASLLVVTASGCQTWLPEAGLTLPTPDYLEHPPQYIPRSPGFRLSRELTSLENAAAAQQTGQVPVPPGQ